MGIFSSALTPDDSATNNPIKSIKMENQTEKFRNWPFLNFMPWKLCQESQKSIVSGLLLSQAIFCSLITGRWFMDARHTKTTMLKITGTLSAFGYTIRNWAGRYLRAWRYLGKPPLAPSMGIKSTVPTKCWNRATETIPLFPQRSTGRRNILPALQPFCWKIVMRMVLEALSLLHSFSSTLEPNLRSAPSYFPLTAFTRPGTTSTTMLSINDSIQYFHSLRHSYPRTTRRSGQCNLVSRSLYFLSNLATISDGVKCIVAICDNLFYSKFKSDGWAIRVKSTSWKEAIATNRHVEVWCIMFQILSIIKGFTLWCGKQ